MANVMIVDDCLDSTETLTRLLEHAGHQVQCVPNGREALAQVLFHAPDVILLDLFMPEMDGKAFLEVLRSYVRVHSVPVVVLTGYPESPLVDRLEPLHVHSVLIKGKASPEEVVKSLEEAVGRTSA